MDQLISCVPLCVATQYHHTVALTPMKLMQVFGVVPDWSLIADTCRHDYSF